VGAMELVTRDVATDSTPVQQSLPELVTLNFFFKIEKSAVPKYCQIP